MLLSYLLNLMLFIPIANMISLVLGLAMIILGERVFLGRLQRRSGPSVVGLLGELQSIADALKALAKELTLPKNVDITLFVFAPIFTFSVSLLGWYLVPYSWDSCFIDYELSLLAFLAIGSFSVYGVLGASWASNSKYSLLGAFRSVGQLISYEIFLSLTLLPLVAYNGSFNLVDFIFSQSFQWNVFTFFPLACIFFIALLAETNRIPFDLPESESEIVAGYNTEYSGFLFALFFLGEYSSIFLNAYVLAITFFGGWALFPGVLEIPFNSLGLTFYLPDLLVNPLWYSFVLTGKALAFVLLWIAVRGCLPRYRYDQLMDLGWKSLLPLTLCFLYAFLAWGLVFETFPFTNQIPTQATYYV